MMRPIILFLLSCAPIWAAGNTCTLADGGVGAACHSMTCALSAIAADTGHSNWTGSGCTAAGYVPSSDYIVIPNGFNLTADQPWIVGNYGLPVDGYVYGVTGLPSGGFSGTCTATFSGGTLAQYTSPAAGSCTIGGGNVATFTLSYRSQYADTTGLTVTFTGSGGGSGTGTIQLIAGGGTPAIQLSDTGVLQISSVATSRGDVKFTGTGSTDAVVGNAGGVLEFDASGASNAANTVYSYNGPNYQGYRPMHLAGASGSHFTLRSNAGGAYGTIGPNAEWYCCGLIATYTDFLRLGSSILPALQDGGASPQYSVQHSTFTSCGILYVSIAGAVLVHDYNTHQSGLASSDVNFRRTASGNSGEVKGNVFSGGFGTNNQLNGVTVQGNYFGNGISTAQADVPWILTRNFFRLGPGAGSGGESGNYYYLDSDTFNPDGFGGSVYPGDSNSISGDVFDAGGDTGGGEGNLKNMSTAGNYTVGVTNNLVIPDAAGFSTGDLFGFFNSSATGAITIEHNTSTASGSDGMVAMEQVPPAGQLASLRSNVVWSLNTSVPSGYNPGGVGATSSQGYFWVDASSSPPGTSAMTDVASPSNVDYNARWQLDGGALSTTIYWYFTAYTNAGGGYIAKFSSPPGGHDLAVNPHFADSTRNLVTFDSSYLGHHYSDWQTGHSYSVGDTVTHPISWFFGGANINYRCIVAHTSDTTTEPGAARYYAPSPNAWVPSGTRGEYWRTYWEPASLYQLRQGVAAQAKITDGAIGCVGCGIIDALRNWVFTGYTPSNPALWCAGHDGETIGAVPFCGKGKAMVAALGGP